MKPENFHKTKSNRSADAKVRSLIRRHIHWLWGYPGKRSDTGGHSSCEWHTLYFQKTWAVVTRFIEQEQVSLALNTHHLLLRDFPRALPRVVGKTDIWSEQVRLKLSAIQALAEGKQVDPWRELFTPGVSSRLLKRKHALTSRYPELAQSLDQFAWWSSLDIGQLGHALDWLEKDASTWQQLISLKCPVEHLLHKLFYLEQHVGRGRSVCLLAMLKQPIFHAAPIHSGPLADANLPSRWRIDPHIRLIESYTHPDSGFMQAICHWLDQVLPSPKQQLRRSFDTLAWLMPLESVNALARRWQLILDLGELCQKRIRLVHNNPPFPAYVATEKEILTKEIEACLKKINASPFPDFMPEQLTQVLLWYADHPRLLDALARVCQAFPDDASYYQGYAFWSHSSFHLFMGLRWYLIYRNSPAHDLGIQIRFVPSIVKYIRADQDREKINARLGILESLVDPWNYQKLTILDSDTYVIAERSDALLSGLAAMCDYNGAPVRPFYLHNFILHSDDKKGVPPDHLATYFHTLMEKNIYITNQTAMNLLHQIADGDGRLFGHVLFLWAEIPEHETIHNECSRDIRPASLNTQHLHTTALLYCSGLGEVADYFTAHETSDDFDKCGQLLTLFTDIKGFKPPGPDLLSHPDLSWLGRYPKDFHPVLTRLARMHPDPETAADRHLGKNYPLPEKLDSEIRCLQDQIHNTTDTTVRHHLQARLQKQQSRLAQRTMDFDPLADKPEKKHRLVRKLIHSANLGLVSRWRRSLTEASQQCVCIALKLPELPDNNLGQARHLTTLVGLCTLDKKMISVASQLLNARLGSGYWDLRDAPANRNFLEKLNNRGIDVKPWIDGIGSIVHTVKNTSKTCNDSHDAAKPLRLHIKLEDDPLEIFHMGNHFDTCLGCLDFNFFSVVTNAADINKRVLYIRDDQWRIVGRCLLALTNNGHILMYHVYSHYQHALLDPVVNDFTNRLAATMHTQVANHGFVSTLVATRWYDDGVTRSKGT